MPIHIACAPSTPGCGSRDAHALLTALYRSVTGQIMPPLSREERGKPFWADSPWHCSITHTRKAAFCALAPFPIGLDAEPIDRAVNPKLPRKVLSPRELAAWQHAENQSETFLTLWTLKESYVKYTGRGLSGYPSDLSFRVSHGAAELDGSGLTFRFIQTHGHILALCAPAEIEIIQHP